MKRGSKLFKTTIEWEDGQHEERFDNVDTFDQAAFLAGVWAARDGRANAVVNVETVQVIENPRI